MFGTVSARPQQYNTRMLLWWGTRKRHYPAHQELPVLGSVVILPLLGYAWRTLTWGQGIGWLVCSFTYSKTSALRGSWVPGLGRRRWNWATLIWSQEDLPAQLQTPLGSQTQNAVSAWKIQGLQALLMASLPSWPTKPPRVKRRAAEFQQLLLGTNHTAFTLTRNYYMQW